ncbi:hypothetical protein F0L68_19070 [Solihabitans fulvus]|uniref:Uncharacterized protein n=1 Tax=Solihabitans fulvus TaxID=1892852 RepID=A0A5B2XDQ0_9PSEU|nr:hypothetical protein [Solihabitans fulvus]KAA2260912.1 hypothetical protein F0L68_19070 [Solihabitans fulvus]
MTRTEDDLRAILAAEQDVPAAEPVMARVRHGIVRRRRRRMASVAVAAAVVVGLVATLPWLLSSSRRAEPAGPHGVAPTTIATSAPSRPPSVGNTMDGVRPTRPAFSFTVQFVDTPELTVKPVGVSPAVQWMTVYTSSTSWADVAVYEPGAFDPSWYLGGYAYTLGHGQGFYREEPWPGMPGINQGVLAWEYRPGAWATVHGESGFPASLAKLAEKVSFGQPTPYRVPFQLDHLPEGLRPNYVGQFPGRNGTLVAFDRPGLRADGPDTEPLLLGVVATKDGGAAFSLDAVIGGPIGGRKLTVENAATTMDSRRGAAVTVGKRDWTADEVHAEFERLNAALTMADQTKPDSWPEAAQAIGGR